MRLRTVIVALAVVALGVSAQVRGDLATALPTLSDPVEGVWRFRDTAGDGATVTVLRDNTHAGRFAVTILDSPDLNIPADARCGYLSPTATPGQYNAEFTKTPVPKPGMALTGTRSFILNLTGDGTFTVSPYNRTHTLSLRRWLPYLFRVSVVQQPDRPGNADGAVRIYPPVSVPHTIIL